MIILKRLLNTQGSFFYYIKKQYMLLYTVLENKNILKSDYLNENIYNLLDLTFVIPEDFSFNLFDVTQEYIARPDLVSLDAYGDTMYADVICKINGISNPFELNEGMTIILPSADQITDFVISPSQSSTSNDDVNNVNSSNSPKTKTKSEKRKANEAIVGDNRFKIDQASGIIIY